MIRQIDHKILSYFASIFAAVLLSMMNILVALLIGHISAFILMFIEIILIIILYKYSNKNRKFSSAFILFVVLTVLFSYLFIQLSSLVFQSMSTPIRNFGCISLYGFNCSNLIYNHLSGNLSVTIGQNTGVTWTAWGIGYASNMTNLSSFGIPEILFSSVVNLENVNSNALISGQTIRLTNNLIHASSQNTTIGNYATGYLWACYTTSSGVTGMFGDFGFCTPLGNSTAIVKYVKIAVVDIKAG